MRLELVEAPDEKIKDHELKVDQAVEKKKEDMPAAKGKVISLTDLKKK